MSGKEHNHTVVIISQMDVLTSIPNQTQNGHDKTLMYMCGWSLTFAPCPLAYLQAAKAQAASAAHKKRKTAPPAAANK